MRHMQAVKKILFRKGDDGGCAEHVGEKMSFTFFFFFFLWSVVENQADDSGDVVSCLRYRWDWNRVQQVQLE